MLINLLPKKNQFEIDKIILEYEKESAENIWNVSRKYIAENRFIFYFYNLNRTTGIIKRSMTDANREQSSGLRHYQDSYLKSMKERISIDESIAIRPTCRSPLPCYHRDDITTRCLFQ